MTIAPLDSMVLQVAIPKRIVGNYSTIHMSSIEFEGTADELYFFV